MTPEERREDECWWCISWICILVIAALLCIYGVVDMFDGPGNPVIDVNQASLNQFHLTNGGTTLVYDLDINVTAHNPNSNYRINYVDVQVSASWLPDTHENRRFATANLNSFEQGDSATTPTVVSLKGQQLITGMSSTNTIEHVVVSNSEGSFPSPRASPAFSDVGEIGAVYDIVVNLYFKNWLHKLHKSSLKGAFIGDRERTSTYVCYLKVPLIDSGGISASSQSGGATSFSFGATRCKRN